MEKNKFENYMDEKLETAKIKEEAFKEIVGVNDLPKQSKANTLKLVLCLAGIVVVSPILASKEYLFFAIILNLVCLGLLAMEGKKDQEDETKD